MDKETKWTIIGCSLVIITNSICCVGVSKYLWSHFLHFWNCEKLKLWTVENKIGTSINTFSMRYAHGKKAY